MMDIPKGPKSTLVRKFQEEEASPASPHEENSSPTNNGSTGKLTSTIQLARPFLTRNQIIHAHSKNVENQVAFDQRRSQVFSFLMKASSSLKFPARVLETSMYYYQRYYILNRFDINTYLDVAVTCLFVASKNEDTIKKLRDILALTNQLRSQTLSSEQSEIYRKKILNFESKLLETISFDFRNFHSEEFLIKFNKVLHKSKSDSYLSWLILFDSYQTEISLKLPPHVIALSSIILASKLEDHRASFKVDFKKFGCDEKLVNEGLLDLLSLYINSFNNTNLSVTHNDYEIRFMRIKVEFDESKPGFIKDIESTVLNKDEFFNQRDFSNGERRYMLESQKKRLYSEIGK
ncbi:hypothetical protein WICMUC_000670 [Wickerhamomyces mucosus]|uniref:Cyclin-like domain-containing protein n=1 Tax=Wickerhamomyces mucosus TaxID=1378264 RepID=A0A9P8PXD3_9ASCO|nr:hypothetical protein WICMUC_000670 [Wickerhamomyces mucosus]